MARNKKVEEVTEIEIPIEETQETPAQKQPVTEEEFKEEEITVEKKVKAERKANSFSEMLRNRRKPKN